MNKFTPLIFLISVLGVFLFSSDVKAFNYGIGYETGYLTSPWYEYCSPGGIAYVTDDDCEGSLGDLCLQTNTSQQTCAMKDYTDIATLSGSFEWSFKPTTSVDYMYLQLMNTTTDVTWFGIDYAGSGTYHVYEPDGTGYSSSFYLEPGDWVWGRFVWSPDGYSWQVYQNGTSTVHYNSDAVHTNFDFDYPPDMLFINAEGEDLRFDRLKFNNAVNPLFPEFPISVPVPQTGDENLDTLLNSMSTRFPWIYLYQIIETLNTIQNTSTASTTVIMTVPSTTGAFANKQFTLFSPELVETWIGTKNLNLFRSILGYFIWLLGIYYLYKRTLRIFH